MSTNRRLKKQSHSLYECKYHIVFCPKYRYKILGEEVSGYMSFQIQQLCEQKKGLEVLELNMQPDHVHLLLSIPPKYAVSDVVGYLKGKLALRMFDRFPELRKRYWGQHLWSRGYCVTTVGIDEDEIRKYVRYQDKGNQDGEQGNLFS